MIKYILIIGVLSIGGVYWYGKTNGAVLSQPSPLPAPPPPQPPPPPPPPPRLTPADTQTISAKLYDSDPRVRLTALERLAGFRGDDADEMLSRQLKIDSETSIRIRIVRILETRGPKEAPPLIYPALNDTEKSVRMAAIEALKNIDAHDSGDILTRMLFDTEPDIRRAALRALNSLSSRRVTKRRGESSYKLPPNFAEIYYEALAHAQGRSSEQQQKAPAAAQ